MDCLHHLSYLFQYYSMFRKKIIINIELIINDVMVSHTVVLLEEGS